jgi:hypothetical protein
MSARSIAPEKLQLATIQLRNHLQVIAVAALDQRPHVLDIVAERGALAPQGRGQWHDVTNDGWPGVQVAVVAPPVLDLAIVGDAELEVARLQLVGRAVVTLDHAGRGGGDAGPEDLARGPGHVAGDVVVMPEQLHLTRVQHGHDVEVPRCVD